MAWIAGLGGAVLLVAPRPLRAGIRVVLREARVVLPAEHAARRQREAPVAPQLRAFIAGRLRGPGQARRAGS